jgi:hypothetical protein
MPTTVTRTKRRPRIKPVGTFEERLHKAADQAREAASRLPACEERETLLQKVREIEAAAHFNEMLAMPSRERP